MATSIEATAAKPEQVIDLYIYYVCKRVILLTNVPPPVIIDAPKRVLILGSLLK